MFGSAAFVSSVLLSSKLLKGRDMNRNNTKNSVPRETETETEAVTVVKADSRDAMNKKRKQPLTSRQTRSEGELEAAETAFSIALTALKSLSQV
jgi:hypothetical protein